MVRMFVESMFRCLSFSSPCFWATVFLSQLRCFERKLWWKLRKPRTFVSLTKKQTYLSGSNPIFKGICFGPCIKPNFSRPKLAGVLFWSFFFSMAPFFQKLSGLSPHKLDYKKRCSQSVMSWKKLRNSPFNPIPPLKVSFFFQAVYERTKESLSLSLSYQKIF